MDGSSVAYRLWHKDGMMAEAIVSVPSFEISLDAGCVFSVCLFGLRLVELKLSFVSPCLGGMITIAQGPARDTG